MAVAEREGRPPGPITLDQLLALNEEIAALVRAGLPLSRGLLEAGGDVRGRLGRIAGVLGRRLNRGEGLAEALEAERAAIPPLYRAVVEAGARAGRLPAALEGLAAYVRSVAEARRVIGMALWYPGMVLALAYVLFVGLVYLVVPRFVSAYQSLGLGVPAPVRWLEAIWAAGPFWLPIGPLAIVLLLAVWIRSGSSAGLRGGSWGGLRWFPWMGPLLSDVESAGFAGLLALLLEHRVPYPSALPLAAEATGSARLIGGARRVAEALAGGASPAAAVEAAGSRSFPPMLRWTLAVGQVQGSLVLSLNHLAELYRRRARYRAEKMAVFLPMALTLGVGAGVAVFYAMSVFLPLIEMLRGLSSP